jgi:hypothetical protein
VKIEVRFRLPQYAFVARFSVKSTEECGGKAPLILNPESIWGEQSASWFGCFTLGERSRCVHRMDYLVDPKLGLVLFRRKMLLRLACSNSLYWLSHCSSYTHRMQIKWTYDGYPKVSGLSHNEITTNTSWEAIQRVMAAKLAILTHKIAIQLHLVAESSTVCSSRSRRPVRKLLITPWYTHRMQIKWTLQPRISFVEGTNFVVFL